MFSPLQRARACVAGATGQGHFPPRPCPDRMKGYGYASLATAFSWTKTPWPSLPFVSRSDRTGSALAKPEGTK